ncbi:WxcM-like domain-containing protein [Aliivibrio finisterrensis]|uniref:WxcM-like domain-containing protein n=1 Tax=Aliivibrio finisterrensis TaxID=511998 RepID=A0A4Q5KDK3_9GAMM|nr:FdtA/QdtA family cupin domain-containing protein [Aliivibrio finisterrensis]RYU44054.1 WxcM-like domain-containing protein [Aliivibrio finisterrensis]
MSLIKTIEFDFLGDERGSLISLEENKNIPFDIKRVYYIFGTEQGVARGFHAHKNLQQVAICVKGSCRFILDNGKCRESIVLDSPSVGLFIGNNKWREMHDFSDDCVLVVLASDYYDEADYIRDYDEFLKEIRKANV